MSEIKYGLISKVDSQVLEKTIDLICGEFKEKIIKVTEIGIYAGETMNGIVEYVGSKGRSLDTTGIDNLKDAQEIIFSYYSRMIIGNSNEVYNKLEDNSQHLIFVDGLHTFAGVVSDFFCYAPKVKVDGYLAFHDTGKHIDPLSGWQGVGDKNDPDMCLGGVRKALEKIGLLEFGNPTLNFTYDFYNSSLNNWQLIFDEADVNDTGGGICVFKKLY